MSIDAAKEKILREIDLSQFVGQTVKLTRRSGNHVGLCPFHEEKSPSFTVFAKNYYCFGCQASGDVITFAMQTKGLSFIDALKFLAANHSLDVGDLDRRQKNSAEDRARATMFRCLQTAQEYFVRHLARPEAEPHRRYLEGRGFSADQIVSYGFGFAPDGGGLTKTLQGLGIAMADIEQASLGYPAKYGKEGGYDFFQSRIMIPIKDSFGRIIAFGGRTVVDHPAKYKNSRETAVFHKSRTLYGADTAASPARKSNRVIVTEGYMDALKLWASGIPETVAVLGTALTAQHMKALSRMASTVFLVFDGDRAGIRAGLKSVEAALTVPGLNIKVLSLPDGHDPDTFVTAHGKTAFIEALAGSEELFQFAIRHTLKDHSGMQVAQVVSDTILPWLATIKDPITRSYLLTKLAQTTGIDQASLTAQLNASGRGQSQAPRAEREGAEREAAPQAGPSGPSGPSGLSRLAVEFLAHIYFLPSPFAGEPMVAEAAELVVGQRADLIALVAAMREKASTLGALADTGDFAWLTGASEDWLPFFARLKERREFFATDEPGRAIELLMVRAKLTKIKHDIGMLKAQLAADPNSLDILAALGKLTDARLNLESQLS